MLQTKILDVQEIQKVKGNFSFPSVYVAGSTVANHITVSVHWKRHVNRTRFLNSESVKPADY